MGRLLNLQTQLQRMLDNINYELSNEVVNEKTLLANKVSQMLENVEDNFLEIYDYGIKVTTTKYDSYLDDEYTKEVIIGNVCQDGDSIYLEDEDGYEHFLDDITLDNVEQVYNAVKELIENE